MLVSMSPSGHALSMPICKTFARYIENIGFCRSTKPKFISRFISINRSYKFILNPQVHFCRMRTELTNYCSLTNRNYKILRKTNSHENKITICTIFTIPKWIILKHQAVFKMRENLGKGHARREAYSKCLIKLHDYVLDNIIFKCIGKRRSRRIGKVE